MASPPVPPIRRPTITSESTRARRFALPDLADERTEESIEAFLHGRSAKGTSPGTADAAVDPQPQGGARPMPGRIDFEAALASESARVSRYARPAAVAILEIRPLRSSAAIDSWLRVHAAPVGQTLLRQSRASDVVARVGATRFQVLLPETGADAAGRYVERIVGACREELQASGAPLRVAASFAAATPDIPLRAALSEAVRSIEAA